jgi:ribosomal protein L11 methyltransferase
MLEVFSNYNINFDSTFKKIPNVDWVSSSQSSFKPICILNKIWIGASWHKIPINQTQKEMLKIFIDPGQAFGTGAHPTTKFCLEALITLSENKKNSHLLDLGCGSGILSIAACKLGFPFVTAVDNDPLALFVAKENAKLNKIGSNSCLFHTSIENTKGKFDLIISNILCSTLLELSSIIVGKLRKNGSLILTGILNAQVSELREKYLRVSKDKIFLREISSEEDWICLAYFGHQ